MPQVQPSRSSRWMGGQKHSNNYQAGLKLFRYVIEVSSGTHQQIRKWGFQWHLVMPSLAQSGWLKLGVPNSWSRTRLWPVRTPGCTAGGEWLYSMKPVSGAKKVGDCCLKQQVSLSQSGGWKAGIRVPVWLGSGCQYGWALGADPLPGLQMSVFFLCPHMAERERDLTYLLVRGLILSPWLHLHPNSLPNASSPKSITFQLRVSTYKFWEVTYFQPIAVH